MPNGTYLAIYCQISTNLQADGTYERVAENCKRQMVLAGCHERHVVVTRVSDTRHNKQETRHDARERLPAVKIGTCPAVITTDLVPNNNVQPTGAPETAQGWQIRWEGPKQIVHATSNITTGIALGFKIHSLVKFVQQFQSAERYLSQKRIQATFYI